MSADRRFRFGVHTLTTAPLAILRVEAAVGAERSIGYASDLVVPKWFEKDARRLGFDLLELKDCYPTAGYEMIALRMLDVDEPCVIAVVDDGVVSARRGNRAPATKKLTAAEQAATAKLGRYEEPRQTARTDGWTATAWPIPGGPFGRIILRSVPDDL